MFTQLKTLLTCLLFKGFKNQDRMTTALRISLLDDNVAKISGTGFLEATGDTGFGKQKSVIYSRSISVPDAYILSNQHHQARSRMQMKTNIQSKPQVGS